METFKVEQQPIESTVITPEIAEPAASVAATESPAEPVSINAVPATTPIVNLETKPLPVVPVGKDQPVISTGYGLVDNNTLGADIVSDKASNKAVLDN